MLTHLKSSPILLLNMVTMLIFIPSLVIILLILSPVISLSPIGGSSNNKYLEKISAYECGLTAMPGQTRSNLTISFYIVAILYLVFDLEIALLIPAVTSFGEMAYTTYSAIMFFIIVLTIGFFYELGSGALNWSKI